MKQIVLGTAGHIDHGKTSLIKALTGIDTDRLKEEKERGITIELGFAHLELPGSKLVGIVDVPGHEKFVKNMVAGATGIDLVALVIAADEGIMPQTQEHLEICQLLGIRHGLVVLTKIDMVDEEWLELVKEDVKEYLAGTFLDDAPMVEVSSATGEGLDRLLQVLDKLVQELPQKEVGHIFRLPIDRVFVIKGFGTVVTGTTVSGKVSLGDEVTIYPEQIQSRVRGIQVHGKEVEEVRAGLRTAINLQGLEKSMIKRGDVVASAGALRSTFMVDVILELLESAPRKLKNRAKARFHVGTAEIISTVVLLDREELSPGEKCFAQLRLERPTAVLRGDKYVLRSYSPVRTIGGGKVLNPLPKKMKRFSEQRQKELQVLDGQDLEAIIETFVQMGGFQGIGVEELRFLTDLSTSKLEAHLRGLKSKGHLMEYDKERSAIIHGSYVVRTQREILNYLTEFHAKYPLKVGVQKEELRSRLKGAKDPKLFNHVIALLAKQGQIVQEKELIRLKSHQVTLGRDLKEIRKKMEQEYLKAGLQPPYFRELKEKLKDDSADDVLELLVGEGVLVKVKEDLYFHRDVIEGLKDRLVSFLKEHGEISTPQFKDMTGASRKYTIPLIEYFDKSQVTVRVGDSRVLRKK